MRILVTGGAGFIGSHLSKRLVDQGHEVVILDNLSTGKRENLPLGAEFVECDLSDVAFVDQIPGGRYDAVCHLAAQSSGEISGQDPLYDVQVNALSTLLLTRWCAQHRTPRFLYASSMAVYGNPKDLPVSESALCEPLSVYGISKLTSEHYLRLAVQEGLSSTSFRMFSVYGPGQNMENLKQGMASIFLAYMLRGIEVPVKGSLDRFRDFIYINDVVDAWMLALAIPSSPSPIYNLGSGRSTTVRVLLRELLHAMDLPADYPVKEMAGYASDQFGLYADTRRLQSDLGWEMKTDLSTGLSSMAKWALTTAVRST